jgi:hypothetical protein
MEELPKNFKSLTKDFIGDLLNTFPEHKDVLAVWNNPEITDETLHELMAHYKAVLPERFFDILYQNAEMFDGEEPLCIVPNLDFKVLFKTSDLSEQSRNVLWRYLQLIMFTVVGNLQDKSSFGDSMNIFEGIDESVLNDKMKETMSGITDFFDNMKDGTSKEPSEEAFAEHMKGMFGDMPQPTEEEINKMREEFEKNMGSDESGSGGSMPDIEKMGEHLKTLFEGKIGRLAKDLADEIADDFKDLLGGDEKNPTAMIQQLMKNPKKITELMKTVTTKLEAKMKSGEISKEELLSEAGDLMQKMKEMGGEANFTKMFKNMAKSMGGGQGGKMRINKNALNKLTQESSVKERMRNKLAQRKQKQADQLERTKEMLRQRLVEQQQYELQQAQQQELGQGLEPGQGQEPSQGQEPANEMVTTEQAPPTDAPAKKKKKKKKKTT